MDTMKITKTVGALCSALLVFLLFGWAADALYGGGHGGEQVHLMDVDEGDATATAEAEDAVPFEEIFAAADPGAGEALWRQCQSCHRLDGSDVTGPHLNGVVGRPKASVAGYAYSDAMLAQADQVWSPENLNAFLANPRGYTPGTKMSYNGMRRVEDRANLIAFLATTDG